MIVIKNLEISPFIDGFSRNNNFLRLTWEFEETSEDLDSWELTVYRSTSPTSGFDVISTPFTNEDSYIDFTVNNISKNRIYYYKLHARDLNGTQELEVGPAHLQDEPDLIGLEIIRRNNLLLRKFNGVPVAIFVKRNFGQRCPDCWDFIASRVKKDKCKTCLGTGRVDGYYEQYSTYCNFNPEPKVLEMAGLVASEDGDTQAWMSNFPVLNPGDIIIEATNKRWRVMSMAPTRKFRHVIHQTMNLRSIKPGDIEYSIPFEDPRSIISQTDANKRRQHTCVAPTRSNKDKNVSEVV